MQGWVYAVRDPATKEAPPGVVQTERDITFPQALDQLLTGSGISGKALAARISVDPAQVSRWRRGKGLPEPENVVAIAREFNVSADWLIRLAYGVSQPPTKETTTLDPRLAAFLSEVEAGWRAMDESARDIAERTARALFHVPPVQRRRRVTDDPGDFGRPKMDRVQPAVPRRKYQSQSLTTQRREFGFMPA